MKTSLLFLFALAVTSGLRAQQLPASADFLDPQPSLGAPSLPVSPSARSLDAA